MTKLSARVKGYQCEAICETGRSEETYSPYQPGKRCEDTGFEHAEGVRLCWVHSQKRKSFPQKVRIVSVYK